MDQQGNDRPPSLVLAFFRWFCHPDFRENIEGDLMERFHNRSVKQGIRKARWLFTMDVLLLFRSGMIKDLNWFTQHKFFTMKKSDWIKLTAMSLLLIVVTISPFLPGPSNKVVLLFSFAIQIMGTFGLLVVPVGLAWTIIEIRRSGKIKDKVINPQAHYSLAIGATLLIALILLLCVLFVPNTMPKVSFFIVLLLMLSGFMLALRQIRKWKDNSERVSDQGAPVILAVSATVCASFICFFMLVFVFMTFGIIAAILGTLLFFGGLFWVTIQIRKLKNVNEEKFNRLPLYLLTFPVIACLTTMFMIDPASSFSRDFAIEKGEVLIASIEAHKKRTGQYPETIQDLNHDPVKKIPKPLIMGIEDFRYNKINGYYSISFSQNTGLGLEEIVLYDKNNLKDKLTGKFANYDYSFDLCRVKGAFASHDTGYAYWKYYLVD